MFRFYNAFMGEKHAKNKDDFSLKKSGILDHVGNSTFGRFEYEQAGVHTQSRGQRAAFKSDIS